MARVPVFASIIFSYSLVYDATDIMDNNNLATSLLAHIQVSIALIGTVKEPSVEPIILAKWWGNAPDKAQKNIQATIQREIWTMFHPSVTRWFRMSNRNLCYHHLAHPVFPDTFFPEQCPEGATDVHKYMPQNMDGLKLSQWHWVVNHMKPCHCCLHGRVSNQLVFMTMQRKWSKVSFIKSSKMIHVS